MKYGGQPNGTEQLAAISGREVINSGELLSVPPVTDAKDHSSPMDLSIHASIIER
jgi:hypothetical protein